MIGVIGGIGAGKSEVVRLLEGMGCVACDSDAQSHGVLASDEVSKLVRARWGAAALAPSGTPDRAAIGRIVFADAAERAWLESIIHPRIALLRKARFAAHPDARAFVIDAPLLCEAGLDRECDLVIFVDAPPELRLARVRATRGWDAAELARREATQWPLDRKRSRAHAVVSNSGTQSDLAEQVRKLLKSAVGHP